MLVISRNNGESVTIGDDIEVTLLVSKTGKARIGISAPENYPIFRSEVRVRKERDAFVNLPVKPTFDS